MQVRVEALREALELLKPAIPKKPTLGVYGHVLLRDGEAIANSLDMAVILEVPGVEGECLVPHKATLKELKRIPGLELLDIRTEGKKLLMAWQSGRSVFETAEVEEFPPVPQVEGEAFRVDGDRLIRAMAAVVPYCAKGGDRPVLTGVVLSPFEEGTDVWAADGFRMALTSLPFSTKRAIVPAEAVKVLEHLWKKVSPAPAPAEDLIQAVLNPRELELTLGQDVATFRFGRVELVTKLIPGSPPSYREIFPDDSDWQKVQFFAQDLERAVRRLKEVGEAIRLRWENKVLRVTAKGEEKEAEAELQVQADGGGRIALKADYLLDYLKGKDGLVSMSVQSEKHPAVFRCSGAPLTVIMPMQVKW